MRFFQLPDKIPAVEIEGYQLQMLMIQTAGCVIQACGEWRDLPQMANHSPREGAIGKRLVGVSQGACPEFMVNCLQSQVDFLSAAMKHVMEHPEQFPMFLREPESVELIAFAVERYQILKTRMCEESERIHGKGWGAGTEFYRHAWDEDVEAFLTRFDRKGDRR